MILRRSLTDAALSTYMAYGVPTCTPEDFLVDLEATFKWTEKLEQIKLDLVPSVVTALHIT
jgi:hypothetical protein